MFSTSGTTTVQFPTLSSGFAATVTLPAANASAVGNLTFETKIPANVAAPAATTIKKRATIGGGSVTTLAVIALTVNTTIAVSSTPAFSFTVPANVSGDAYIAYYDENNASNGWNVLLGPGTTSGNTISFSSQPVAPPIQFVSGDTYVFALVTTANALSPAAVTYSGTKSVNYSYGYEFGYPAPGPTATAPPTTLSYNVTTSVSVGSSPFPTATPKASLIDEHIAETDASNLSSTSFTTDEWAGTANTGGSAILSIYGTQEQEPSSADLPVYTTIYGSPQIADEYPETNGASWTNTPAATETYSFANGDTGVRTIASNGTYTDTEQIGQPSGGQPAILTENADGSGSITGPYFSGGLIAGLTFSAPMSGEITFTESFTTAAQTYYGFPPSESLTDPVWYATPPVFYSETDNVTAGAAIPQACGTTFGTKGTQVQRSVTTLDTVNGFIETTVMDSYDVGAAPVCLNTTDTLNYAYDQQGDSPYLIIVDQLGLEVVTTTETLKLQSAGASGLPGTPVTATATVAALENHELASFARARVLAEHSFLTGIRSRNAASLKIQGGIR